MKLKYLCVNANGLQQRGHFDMFLKACGRWRDQRRINVFMVQEHNLNSARLPQLKRDAAAKNFHLSIAFAPAASDGNHWGGTLILTDTKTAIVEICTAHEPGALSARS